MAATFSYAQAAKGIVSTQPSAKTTPAEPTKAVSKPEDQNTDSTSQPEADTVIFKTEEPETENMTVSVDKELADKESEPTAAVDVNVSGTSSPSVDTSSTSTLPKDEEESATPNGTSESTWDKQSQASGSEKPNSAEGTKDTKDKATAEKEKKAASLKELKAAPLPAVNIWQQRKEAQEAKVKATAALKPAAKTGTSKAASTASSTSADNQQDPSKVSKKKGADTASEGVKDKKKAEVGKGREDSSRKSGSRSGRQVKANGDSPDVPVPPVGDAALWPTPQVAQGEEKKKSQGKTDKSDKAEKSPVIRPHGKEKWTPVPYVPTAVFNTPLPSAGRRGGRAARTGRDSGRNGAQGAPVVAKEAVSGQAAQSSTAKPIAERGMNEPNSARANSLPAPAKRSNSTDAGLTDSRKATQAADRSRGPKGAENANPAPTGKHGNGGENFQRQKHDGKPFARNSDAAHKGGDHSKNSHVSTDAHTGPRAGSTPDRRLENGPKSADAAGFHADRKENPRESRADRGRGSHRGRGGHSGFGGSQNSQFPNNHVSHHSFVHQKAFGFNDRQRSQHGLPNGSQRGHPLSIRSPSLPSSASMYGAYPFPADINTVYNYQPMSAGPMSAVPYQHYMEPFSLMSMISMQLEYYFSVDNLCKDLFLRKQMDSQGFVPLSVIASFKRIKTLTEDYELLRHVCRQLRNVEYQVGEDGVDRLRSRERWEQWVLPIDQRDLSAQHEGPPPTTNTGKPDEQDHVEGATNGLPNGTAESHVLKTSLSSTAPEFSPSTFVNAQNEIANRAD